LFSSKKVSHWLSIDFEFYLMKNGMKKGETIGLRKTFQHFALPANMLILPQFLMNHKTFKI